MAVFDFISANAVVRRRSGRPGGTPPAGPSGLRWPGARPSAGRRRTTPCCIVAGRGRRGTFPLSRLPKLLRMRLRSVKLYRGCWLRHESRTPCFPTCAGAATHVPAATGEPGRRFRIARKLVVGHYLPLADNRGIAPQSDQTGFSAVGSGTLPKPEAPAGPSVAAAAVQRMPGRAAAPTSPPGLPVSPWRRLRPASSWRLRRRPY